MRTEFLTEEIEMKVKFTLDVFIDEDDKADCTSEIWWNSCNWGDVTLIQGVFIEALVRLNKAGYEHAILKDELTPDMAKSMQQIITGAS